MAFNRAPSPALTCAGMLRSLDVYETGEKSSYGAGKRAGRVSVLTEHGGFIEVYVEPSLLPDVEQLAQGSELRWLVEVDVFTQTSAKGNRFSTLSAKLVRDLDAKEIDEATAARNIEAGFGAHAS